MDSHVDALAIHDYPWPSVAIHGDHGSSVRAKATKVELNSLQVLQGLAPPRGETGNRNTSDLEILLQRSALPTISNMIRYIGHAQLAKDQSPAPRDR